MADVLVMNKLDTATPELVGDFQKWADGLFPPKLLIAGTTHGRLDPRWLDLSANDERLPLYPQPLAASREAPHALPPKPQAASASQGSPSPRRYLTPPGTFPACGWVFDAADVFDEGKLLALLANTKQITRAKGVFHLPDEWASVNRVGTAVSVAPTAYRRDSRLEVFAEGLDWDEFEKQLVGCLLPRPARNES
jgi:G3E family GTPase